MPTPVITHTNLGWAYQTGFVNRVKTPSSFLTRLVFGGRELALPTESAELSFRDGERLLAPMVEVNAEAIPVGGRSTTFANISCPNIRIKRPMEAYNVFLRRQPATGMFISGGGAVARARTRAIAEDALYMVEMVENRLEWMVSKLVTGNTSGSMVLEYQVEDKANWKVTIPRSTDMTRTLSSTDVWGGATADLKNDFLTVKRAFSKHVNRSATVCIMDSLAADEFIADPTVQSLLDKQNIDAGNLALQSQFNQEGAIYHGRFMGIPCWEYSREFVNDAGSAEGFMPDNTAVFLAGGALRDSRVLYGAIPDHDAFDQGLFVGRRFSKSWKEPDPSVYIQLLQTRPLPHIRQPNSVYVLTTG